MTITRSSISKAPVVHTAIFIGTVLALSLNASCLPKATSAGLKDAGGYSGGIFVSLDHPVSGATNQYTLAFSAASSTTNSLGFCTAGLPSECKPGATNYTAVPFIYDDNTTKFFSMTTGTTLTDGFAMTIVTADLAGKITDTRSITYAVKVDSGTNGSGTNGSGTNGSGTNGSGTHSGT